MNCRSTLKFLLPIILLTSILEGCMEREEIPWRGGSPARLDSGAGEEPSVVGCKGDEECLQGFRCEQVSPRSFACIQIPSSSSPPPRPLAPRARLLGVDRFLKMRGEAR